MCTLSWIRGVAGYSVFMNRDERPTRAPGRPPEIREGRVPWVAPIDRQSHGTWIGANTAGITLAILNRFHDSPMSADAEWISRGLLVTSLLEESTKDDVERRLRDEPLSLYQPFTLVVFEVDRGARLCAWNGSALAIDSAVETGMVVTSSGYDQELATKLRGHLFRRWRDFADPGDDPSHPSPALFERIHASHLPERGPLSICMHRPEAATVSFTRVDVRPDAVTVGYVPGPPGEYAERVTVSLPRTAAPG